jgi:hypothetical protein
LSTALFGAFDRHNLDDILLAAMAAAEHPGAVCAGLAARDMSPFAGPRVAALESLRRPLRLIHVGGKPGARGGFRGQAAGLARHLVAGRGAARSAGLRHGGC